MYVSLESALADAATHNANNEPTTKSVCFMDSPYFRLKTFLIKCAILLAVDIRQFEAHPHLAKSKHLSYVRAEETTLVMESVTT